MPPKKRNPTLPGIRTSPRGKAKRRARTTKQSVAESPGTWAKRKEKAAKAKANAEAEADAEANAKAASKAAKQKKKIVGRSPNKAKKASQKKYVIPNKDDVSLSPCNTDGSEDEESYVVKLMMRMTLERRKGKPMRTTTWKSRTSPQTVTWLSLLPRSAGK